MIESFFEGNEESISLSNSRRVSGWLRSNINVNVSVIEVVSLPAILDILAGVESNATSTYINSNISSRICASVKPTGSASLLSMMI